MMYPTMCIDNFFKNPQKVKEFALSLKYIDCDNGRWPGARTENLFFVNKEFHRHVGRKMLAALYPTMYERLHYSSGECYFQKVGKEFCNEGWIHCDDPVDLTVIVYLSDHTKCGTSIYDYNNLCPDHKKGDDKIELYLNKDFKKEKKIVEKYNSNFTETIRFNSKFNRMICFDSYAHHGVPSYVDEGIDEDRLTLVCFYKGINAPKFHGAETNRI
tara:strand:+ start:103 stop:747 length:645 start_codon:yes stop_codon:yes gene_type:complete